MATYSITTSREREVGLKWSYDHYADKTTYTTQQMWFQHQIDFQVGDSNYQQYLNDKNIAFDASIKTIPEANKPKAEQEIQQVIVDNGGTLVPAGPPISPVTASLPGGSIPTPGGAASNSIQVGAGTQAVISPNRTDDSGDKSS